MHEARLGGSDNGGTARGRMYEAVRMVGLRTFNLLGMEEAKSRRLEKYY
jgi:hypothetical protein